MLNDSADFELFQNNRMK